MRKAFYCLLMALLLLLDAPLLQALAQQLQPVYQQTAVTQKLGAVRTAGRMSATDTAIRKMPPYKINLRKLRNFSQRLQVQELQKKAAGSDTEHEQADKTPIDREPNIWSNYLAASYDEFPFITPPDPNGDVSSTQVVVATNAFIRIFAKKTVTEAPTTTPMGGSLEVAGSQITVTLDNFFNPVLPIGSFTSDPHVRYDRTSKRWFFVAIEVNQSFSDNRLLLAVTDSEVLDENTGLYYYAFPLRLVIPQSTQVNINPFLDYPTLGVDRNAMVVGGVSFFPNNFGGADSINMVGMLMDKKRMLNGQLRVYGLKLGRITASAADGIYVPQGVHNDDPAASKSFFAGLGMNWEEMELAEVSWNNTTGVPTGSARKVLKIDPYYFPRDVTAPGSPMVIDPLDTRLLAATIRKNKTNGKSSLWTAHAVGLNQQGTTAEGPDFQAVARTSARWYQVGDIYDVPRITQYGNVFDPSKKTGARAISYFNPSVVANGQGFVALSGTTAAYNRHLNVFVAHRFATDPVGTLSMPKNVTDARAIYAFSFFMGGYVGRWGDYSQTVVDPDDDQTLWTFQQYANWDDTYGTRAIQIKAPPPATPLPLGTLGNNRDTVIAIKGMSVNNSGFFDPGADAGGPGFNRLRVTSTGNIIATNLQWRSPTEIRVRLNTRNKPAGTYTLVISNPDGQIVTTTFELAAPAVVSRIAPKDYTETLQSMRVLPNPTPGAFRLQFSSTDAYAGRVFLLDLTGKRLSEQRFSINKGMNDLGLSLGSLSKGTYIAALYDTQNRLVGSQVIVKQ